MIKSIFILVFVFLGKYSFAQTQAELNAESYEELKRAEEKLSQVINQLLIEYSSDSAFCKNLKESQKIWNLYRDSELRLRYPTTSGSNSGSIYLLCQNIYLTSLTVERIDKLSLWLIGIEEGDVCLGSVKMKE